MCLGKSLTVYTQNIYGDTIMNYEKKNINWWMRRFEYHSYVKNLFYKKKKFNFKFIDYYLTYLIRFLF